MGMFDYYKIEAQFEKDFPNGVPNEYWHSMNGDVLVSEMTDQHIKNCMKFVGKYDPWYNYFQKELNKRNNKILKNKIAKSVCMATQKTNYNCVDICENSGSCAYCIVMAEQLIENGITIIE